MKWFSPSTVTNSTVLPKIFSALNSWMLSPIGTLVSAVPCNNNKGVLILSALNSEPCLVNSSGFSKDNCRQLLLHYMNTPIAFSPIACHIADAGMRNRGCEDVGLCLQVLGHESSVGCTQTAYFLSLTNGCSLQNCLVPSMISSAVRLPHALTWRAENSCP